MMTQLIQQTLRFYTHKPFRQFIDNTQQGTETQKKLLRQILTRNATCKFGQQYGFSQLRTLNRERKSLTFVKLVASLTRYGYCCC